MNTTSKEYSKQIGQPVDESNKFVIQFNQLHKRLANAIKLVVKERGLSKNTGIKNIVLSEVIYKDPFNANNDINGYDYEIFDDGECIVSQDGEILKRCKLEGTQMQFFELNVIWQKLCDMNLVYK